MCGIVGAVAQRDVAPILLEGLRRLEYRGYDSAGMAVINQQQQLLCRRTVGKVKELADALAVEPITGNIGIAHTRWATHGKPSEVNAHPHISNNDLAVVHNGIIENHEPLREQLRSAGYHFNSETDTEIVVHLLHQYLTSGKDFLSAVRIVADELEGAYALAFIDRNDPTRLIALRYGSPLVIGLGIGENFVASDRMALASVAQKFIYLEDGDIADVQRQKVTIYNRDGEIVQRKIHAAEVGYDAADRGGYRHFMLKEIHEQPDAIAATLQGRLSKQKVFDEAFGTQAHAIFDHVQRVQIVACGTSFHAGMVAKYWLESLAGIPAQVEIASEIRYRNKIVEPNTLFVTLSQSGETADTLAALKLAKTQGYLATLSICNVPESSIVRESDLVLMTSAGPEIGVASTKAFTTQLTAMMMLTLALGRRFAIKPAQEQALIADLQQLPSQLKNALELDGSIQKLAKLFVNKYHALFLGRGIEYPIAMEGALKLKEISYIHAEAYPAGELKHGPLALVDKDMPVVMLAPQDDLLEKLKSNLEEVRARGGELIVFASQGAKIEDTPTCHVLTMPEVNGIFAPIVYTLPLQLLAYHVAVLKGTDVDQPRNLAKSVTVE